MHFAAQAAAIETVSILFDLKADVVAENYVGNSPLHLACQITGAGIPAGAMIQMLLAAKSDIEQDNANGETPLQVACHAGATAGVKTLLAYGASFRAVNYMKRTTVHVAVARGHTNLVELMITTLNPPAIVIKEKKWEAMKAIHEEEEAEREKERKEAERIEAERLAKIAEKEAEKAAAEALLLAPLEAQIASKEELAGLFSNQAEAAAAAEAKKKSLQRPASAGAESDSSAISGATDEDAEPPPPPPPKFGRFTLIWDAIRMRDTLLLKDLPKPVAPSGIMDHVDRDKRAFLMLAVASRQAEMVRLVLEMGANVNKESDVNGDTPLILAAVSGQERVVQMLLEKRADVKKTNNAGLMAADMAKTLSIRGILHRHQIALAIQASMEEQERRNRGKQEKEEKEKKKKEEQGKNGEGEKAAKQTEEPPPAPIGVRLRVDHLPDAEDAPIQERQILSLLRRLNSVKPLKVDVKSCPITGRPRGHAYIEFETDVQAEIALSSLEWAYKYETGAVIYVIKETVY